MAPEEGAIHLIKLGAADPHAYLTRTLSAIVRGLKQSQIDTLLAWNNLAA
jgi:transposase